MINASGECEYTRDFPERPDDPAGKPGRRWLPFIEIATTPTASQVKNGYAEAEEAGQWVRRHQVRGMTPEEIEAQRVAQLRESDNRDMARMVEDILVIVAQSGGVALSRDSFPAALWNKINARRAWRGLEPV